MVVDKLPHSLCVKWKECRREKELKHATLLDYEKWIELQAEVHDDWNPDKQDTISPTRS